MLLSSPVLIHENRYCCLFPLIAVFYFVFITPPTLLSKKHKIPVTESLVSSNVLKWVGITALVIGALVITTLGCCCLGPYFAFTLVLIVGVPLTAYLIGPPSAITNLQPMKQDELPPKSDKEPLDSTPLDIHEYEEVVIVTSPETKGNEESESFKAAESIKSDREDKSSERKAVKPFAAMPVLEDEDLEAIVTKSNKTIEVLPRAESVFSYVPWWGWLLAVSVACCCCGARDCRNLCLLAIPLWMVWFGYLCLTGPCWPTFLPHPSIWGIDTSAVFWVGMSWTVWVLLHLLAMFLSLLFGLAMTSFPQYVTFPFYLSELI